jgi:hypothetical protein
LKIGAQEMKLLLGLVEATPMSEAPAGYVCSWGWTTSDTFWSGAVQEEHLILVWDATLEPPGCWAAAAAESGTTGWFIEIVWTGFEDEVMQ